MNQAGRWLLAAALTAGTISTASAGSLDPGTRIRWTTTRERGGPTIGSVVAMSAETLVARAERETSPRVWPLESLASLEISAGRPNRCARGAAVGALGGAAGGLGAAYILRWVVEQATEPFLGKGENTTRGFVVFTAAGAGIGATIGAVVGANLRGPERWEPARDLRLPAAGR